MTLTMTRAAGLVAGALLLAVSGCGGDDDDDDGGAGDTTVDDGAADDGAADDDSADDDSADDDDAALDVDNCSLLTDEEASTLAGEELAAQAGDSPLGCPYAPPDEVVGDIVVNSVRHDGDLASLAATGFPNAASVTPIDGVGEESVAVLTPAGDAVASILARQGDLVVELQVVFLLIEPDDTAAVQIAGEYAAIALERLVDAS
jgi:hypothetical protein